MTKHPATAQAGTTLMPVANGGDSPFRPHATASSSGSPSPAGAATVGLGIGVLLCLLNVLVLFRTGAGFGGSALVVLLSAVLLSAWGRLTWSQMFIAFSVASSGYFATAAIDSSVAAIRVHGADLPPGLVLVVVAVAANLVGVAIGAVVARGYVERDELSYPTIQPAIALIASTTGTAGGRTRVLIGASAGAALVATVAILFGWDGGLPIAGLPSFLTVAVSPLLVGVGMLVGTRACLWLAVGGAYSALVWWLHSSEAATVSYDAHLAYPLILAGGVGVVVGHIVVTMVRHRGPLWQAVRVAVPRRRLGIGAPSVAAVGLAVVVLLRPEAGRWIVAAVLGLVLLLLWVHFLNRAGGEIGFAPIAPVLILSVVVFALLRIPATTTLLVSGAVCCAALASLYYTYAVKVAASAPAGQAPPVRRVWWTQALGGTVGACAGIGLVVVLVAGQRAGGHGFPIPIAHALSLVEATARGSSGYGGAVGATLAAGGVAGVLLSLTTALPTMLGLGILLPPAFTLALVAGGGARRLIEWRRRDAKQAIDHAASGLIIGEGIIMIVFVIYRAFAQ
jgi:hypothetical protein